MNKKKQRKRKLRIVDFHLSNLFDEQKYQSGAYNKAEKRVEITLKIPFVLSKIIFEANGHGVSM